MSLGRMTMGLFAVFVGSRCVLLGFFVASLFMFMCSATVMMSC